jgi:hypothetical protein
MPFMGSWTTRYPSANAQPIRDFADAMERFNQVHGTSMKAAKTGDMGLMKNILANESPTSIALHFNHVRLSKEESALFAEHPETSQFLSDQVRKAGSQANLQAAGIMMNADTAMKTLRELADQVYNAPETANMPMLNEPSAAGNPKAEGQTHGLSPTDKSMLLDRIYGWQQRISERGLANPFANSTREPGLRGPKVMARR